MVINGRFVLPTFVFLLFGYGPATAVAGQSVASNELLGTVQNEVSGERAWDLVSKISRYHRIRGGGEGSDYNRCVEWLAEELMGMGVSDVKIRRYKADGFQRSFLWRSLVGWKVKEAELWITNPYKKRICLFSDQAVSLMPYSRGGRVESELVFVGEGKSDADYRDRDVRGKLVFALGGGGAEVHRQAVLKRGAAGVIVGPSNREDRLEYPDLVEVNRLAPTGEEKSKTGFGFSLSRRQQTEILSLLEDGQKIVVKAIVDAELFDGDMPVLEAVLPGESSPDQEIILMGHLDHYKPGANDNASGSAGMVEMVRCIVSLTERGEIPPLGRTVRFLWVPEYHGTAPYLVENLDIRGRGIAGMNLDMIGEDYRLCRSHFNLTRAPYSVPGYINDVLANLLPWLERNEFFSPRGSRYVFNFRVTPYSGGSDHAMFNDGALSIPTVMLGHPDVFHHTNLDTPDKCDPTEMKRIISLALAATLLLANADDEDAIGIAGEVWASANLRMAEQTRRSIGLLRQFAADESKRNSCYELFENVRAYPALHAEIEAANVLEVQELCQGSSAKSVIRELARDLAQQAERESEKLNRARELFVQRHGADRTPPARIELYRGASTIRPRRLFQGPLPGGHLQDKIGVETYRWYQENSDRAGGDPSSKMYEIINLMDGSRTLLDIRHIVSFEFDETDIEFVLHYAEDLKNAGLIEY